jgi:hypothetical protein
MLRILDRKWLKTGSPSSRLAFESQFGQVGIGNRYLLLDGKRAYDLGNNCQTCALLFQRLDGANAAVNIEETVQALRRGLSSLEDDVVEIVGLGVPNAEYLVYLAEMHVTLVLPGQGRDYFVGEQIALWGEDTFWCLPHDPRVPYYRAGERNLGAGRKLFSFVVPMFPTKWLKMGTVSAYSDELRGGTTATAISLAVLDVKRPADWEGDRDPTEHWCLSHYLIDGHHKLLAASDSGQSLRLLSFLALSQGVSTREDVEEVACLLMQVC